MAKTFWIHIALFSYFLVLMVDGRIRVGWWSRRVGSIKIPSYPKNTGSQWNSGSRSNNYNFGGSNYRLPESKTNVKHMAGAAMAGGVGGFMLSNTVRSMRYRFDNGMDYRYYNRYRNQMPSRVYRPMYQISYVTEDRFVADCYNMSTTEYVIKPNEGKNISDLDQTEVRVKNSVIQQLCVREYKRGPEYYSHSSGLNLLFSPSLILFITLSAYLLVE